MSFMIVNTIAFLVFSVYPPDQSGLKFNHRKHVIENEMNCVDCHTVTLSKSANDKNIPGHDTCGDCHSVENSPEDCVLCHTNPDDPTGVVHPAQELIFPHRQHLKDKSSNSMCLSCHPGIDQSTGKLTAANFPTMNDCFKCHDGSAAPAECTTCHSKSQEMTVLIHDPGWKYEHRYATDLGGQNCAPCHQTETFCSKCHEGDNLVETVHELNYRDSHGLDAKGNEYLCQSCHDFESFCTSCHAQEGAEPFSHTVSGWDVPPYRHADAAMEDPEVCAACHSTESPVCSRCHFDTDGILGTNPPIHPSSIDNLDHGPWHDDPSFQCFICHVDTRTAGVGFCGYCHGNQD